MAQTSPIDWIRFERAVHAWFTRETGVSALWACEHASQPAYPFGSLKRISGPISYGRDDERYSFDPKAPAGEDVATQYLLHRYRDGESVIPSLSAW
jgi:hypothetical protein